MYWLKKKMVLGFPINSSNIFKKNQQEIWQELRVVGIQYFSKCIFPPLSTSICEDDPLASKDGLIRVSGHLPHPCFNALNFSPIPRSPLLSLSNFFCGLLSRPSRIPSVWGPPKKKFQFSLDLIKSICRHFAASTVPEGRIAKGKK